MSLPIETLLPLSDARLENGSIADLRSYLRDLVGAIKSRDEDLVRGSQGDIRQFTPVISGNTSAGSGAYSNRYGWYLRQNLMVDVWFDVTWVGHTGTGQAYLELPYKAKLVEGIPMVGQVYPSTIALTASYTHLFMSAISDSFKGAIYQAGSGVAVANLTVPASGRLLGHIRYIGQTYER